MVFPVVMNGCESWTVKKAEHWRIDVFELWCWRRLETARTSNQSILKEISPEYSLEGLMLKLKLQYFDYLTLRTDFLEKTLMLGRLKAGEGDDRGWDGRITSPTWRTFVWPSSGSWWWTEKPDMLQSPGLQRVRHDWAIELNWPEGPLWRRVALWTPFPRNYFPSVLFPGFPRPQVLIHNPPWHSPILP